MLYSFCDNAVHEDKNKYGNCQLEQNSSNGEFGVYFEPVFWIWRVTLPEPPEYHCEELEGEEDTDNNIEQFPRYFSFFWERDDFFAKLSWSVFEDGNSEKEAAEHKT